MKKALFTFVFLFFTQQMFAEKYNFLFFYNEPNQKMQEVFENAMQKQPDRASYKLLQKNGPEAKQYIQQYSLQHAPMPFVLVLAPNGAIMGGFPTHFTEEQLLSTFSTPVVEKSLKALQTHKLVLLCLQNEQTKSNKEAMQGVEAFKSDPKYRNATEVITVDPLEAQDFLKQLNIETNKTEATTVLLAPPADVVGKFTGPTTKEQLTSALNQATSGCCPGGCCPGGCCP